MLAIVLCGFLYQPFCCLLTISLHTIYGLQLNCIQFIFYLYIACMQGIYSLLAGLILLFDYLVIFFWLLRGCKENGCKDNPHNRMCCQQLNKPNLIAIDIQLKVGLSSFNCCGTYCNSACNHKLSRNASQPRLWLLYSQKRNRGRSCFLCLANESIHSNELRVLLLTLRLCPRNTCPQCFFICRLILLLLALYYNYRYLLCRAFFGRNNTNL